MTTDLPDMPLWWEIERNLLEALRLDPRWPDSLGDANIFPTWNGLAAPFRIRSGATEGLSEAFFQPDSVFPFLALQALQLWDLAPQGPGSEPNRLPIVCNLQILVGDTAREGGTRQRLDEIIFALNVLLREHRELIPKVEGLDGLILTPGPLLTVPIAEEPRVAGWIAQARLTLVGKQIGG